MDANEKNEKNKMNAVKVYLAFPCSSNFLESPK